MATIAKITNGASAASALNYALGKDKELHNDTKQWLEDNRLERPPELTNCRAVAVGGTNGIDISIANEQFKIVQQSNSKTQSGATHHAIFCLERVRPYEYQRLATS